MDRYMICALDGEVLAEANGLAVLDVARSFAKRGKTFVVVRDTERENDFMIDGDGGKRDAKWNQKRRVWE